MSVSSGIGIFGVGTVSVRVSDQDQAVDFYVNRLGMEKRRDFPMGAGGRWIEVAPPGSTTTVSLAAPAADTPGGGPGGYDTGIRLLTRDAQTAHDALVGGGVEAGPVLRWPGVPPMFSFQDPDGNKLYLVQQG